MQQGRGTERPEPDDALHIDVSDLAPMSGAPATPPPRRTPRRRLTRLVVALATALVAVVVLASSLPAAREAGRGLLKALEPTPTPPILPGGDLFYLLPNPPGVFVSLDGRTLTTLPVPGGGNPLRLARGRHTFAWRSHTLPFRPLQCRLSVPHASSDTCPFVPVQSLPQALRGKPGSVIAMHGSLAALAPQDAAALTVAIQAALDASRSTALVQPGERYYFYDPGQIGAPVVTPQPLRATRSYEARLGTAAGYPEPCVALELVVPCHFSGQDCSQLCTIGQPPPSVAGPPGTWLVATTVGGVWDYTTLDGHIVVQHLGDPAFNLYLAVLRITWDGAGWHATPIFGHTPGLDVTDDAACDPMREALSFTSVWSFMIVDPPAGAQVQFASDASPGDGCAGALNQVPGSTQPALFLYRFGVLLTVNDQAADSLDNLPVANPAEQRLAQQLLAHLQP